MVLVDGHRLIQLYGKSSLPNCNICLIPDIPKNISVTRFASEENDGSSNYDIGLTGGAATEGKYLYLAIVDDSTSDAKVLTSGWTRLEGGFINVVSKSAQVWRKKAGPSEPTSYTIESGGNGSCAALIEIDGADSDNPDGTLGIDAETDIAPTAIGTTYSDAAIIFALDVATSNVPVPPDGYTTVVSQTNSFSNMVITVAFKADVGPIVAVSPGVWTLTAANVALWTELLKG